MDASSITTAELQSSIGSDRPPIVIDVRKQERFRAAHDLVRGALWRDPLRISEWSKTLPRANDVVVYCMHGHEVSQGVAKSLATAGIPACYLEGGIEGWREAGGDLFAKPRGAATRWVTRERPKIDRIACPWLVARFVDPEAEFLYVPAAEVKHAAQEREAVPYDIPEVEFSHMGDLCSFDAFLSFYRLNDPALDELGLIVRGADTGQLELAPQCAGLAAISLGLSRTFADDHEMLKHGMVMYDALYRWCREGKQETHTWNPQAYAA